MTLSQGLDAMTDDIQPKPLDARRQRLRSVAIGLALGFMVLLFYAATIVRMGGLSASG